MALRSTIHQIQMRDSELAAIAEDRDAFVAEWIQSVERLYTKISADLKDLQDEGVVQLSSKTVSIKEHALGEYEISQLKIRIASRLIMALPVARLTTGGTGRVDLYRSDRPGESERVLIVRELGKEGPGNWLIEYKSAEDRSPLAKWQSFSVQIAGSLVNRSARNYHTLDKLTLEDALDYLLQ